jgi:putative nucleotidyltransferase with HDIG domain
LPKTDSSQTKLIIKRIHDSFSKEKVQHINLSVSFGWETKRDNFQTMEEVFKKAEDFMYRRKLYESSSMRYKTITLIINTLYEKNKREEEHSRRVGYLCKQIATALGLGQENINELQTAGLMHDIGKISVSEDVLNKDSSLSDSEWSEIKRHPEIGYNILRSVTEYASLAEYVLAHHERWDGKGYPKGLKGELIPLQARIIGLADSYDMMTSERPYGIRLSREEAVKEIIECSGKQFDPELVKVFIEKVFAKLTA